jgi:hypothetical protein
MTDLRPDVDERRGTLFVLEDDPPPTRPRWFCHWDGEFAPGFESPEEAVAWGLSRARTVIVRTLGAVFYWAGERPSDEEGYEDLRAWAAFGRGTATDRHGIRRGACAAEEDDAARQAYERERERWLVAHAPELAGRGPTHVCLVFLPEDENVCVELEELDPNGDVCGTRRQGGGPFAFGTMDKALAAASGRPIDDTWINAVCAALGRERNWTSTGRRSMLEVKAGEGEVFHVTAAENRESISRHGLDWSRMTATTGIAGSQEPELPAIFLCESLAETTFFTEMASVPTDVWAVRVDGLWIESGPDGWLILAEPVLPERLRLVETDVPPSRDR